MPLNCISVTTQCVQGVCIKYMNQAFFACFAAAMGLPRATPVHHIARNCPFNKASILVSSCIFPTGLRVRHRRTYAEEDEGDHDVAEELCDPNEQIGEHLACPTRYGWQAMKEVSVVGGLTRLFQFAGLARRANLSTAVALWTPTRPVRLGGPFGRSQMVRPICVPVHPHQIQSCVSPRFHVPQPRTSEDTYNQQHQAQKSNT